MSDSFQLHDSTSASKLPAPHLVLFELRFLLFILRVCTHMSTDAPTPLCNSKTGRLQTLPTRSMILPTRRMVCNFQNQVLSAVL